MNKKFLQTAAVTVGLTIFTLPLAACNTRSNYNMNPARTGIVQRQNTIQNNQPVRFSTRNNTNMNNTRLDNAGRIIASPVPGYPVPASPVPGYPVPGTVTNTVDYMRQQATNLKGQVKSVPQVKDANVVVVGNTALVACSPSTASVDRNVLRTAITQRVKGFDPNITNVVVTESPDMMNNVSQMLNNMTTRPMNQITQDFNNLIRQITPTTAR